MVKGYVLGCMGAITYGLNPLFAMPLYAEGLDVASVLFYRYLIAILLMAALMSRHGGFRLSRREIPAAVVAGVLFAMSSFTLFESYNYMDVGIASTILFVYPVFVALIMAGMFREKISVLTILCMALALGGIAMLYDSDGSGLSAVGTVLIFGSAISYAIYMVAVNKSRLSRLSTLKLSFYSLLFGIIVFVIQLKGLTDLKPLPPTISAWGNLLGISIFPTVVSLIAMTVAIHCIGSVPVSILGALEPVTAIVVGVSVLGESLTTMSIAGVVLIITAVTMLAVSRPLLHAFSRVCRHRLHLRHRHGGSL